jgi:hypothetical protein
MLFIMQGRSNSLNVPLVTGGFMLAEANSLASLELRRRDGGISIALGDVKDSSEGAIERADAVDKRVVT